MNRLKKACKLENCTKPYANPLQYSFKIFSFFSFSSSQENSSVLKSGDTEIDT